MNTIILNLIIFLDMNTNNNYRVLCDKLIQQKFRDSKKRRTLQFDKPVNFSNRILIGNWVEERSAYKKNKFNHKSIYSDEYVQKPFSATDTSNFMWDQKIRAEGRSVAPVKTSNEPCSFHDNYSTMYDLSYKYFPNCYGAPIFRNWRFRLGIYEPQDEYLNSYGNVSNYGLSDYKKKVWKCDLQDPRTTVTTSYGDSFLYPEKSDYTFLHWCRTSPKKGNHPSLSECNVITWECKNK